MATTAEIPPQPGAAAQPAPSFKRPLIVTLYVVFAWATGVMVSILVFIGIPLQYWAHTPQVDEIVGLIHGVFLYPEYCVLAIIVAFVYRLSIPHMALMALAGLVPGLSPYVAGRTVKHVAEKQAQKARKQAAREAKAARKAAAAAKAARRAQEAGTGTDGPTDAAAAIAADTDTDAQAKTSADASASL